ncbi:MAG TPA: Holliday junction branch migration protein RuvA [Anaeromyxobacteraceae bacterium]|nr:Holliday junction branch migration protein RuvA [Anaeromyxobacteraceae bacterium]
MIARLDGVIVEKRDGAAVVDVNGVGYLVHVSASSLAALPEGERVRLRTYTHVREDALDLFGFATEEEEAVFRELIGVKNVGPRAAQNILSGIEPRELAAAVASGDVARLTRVPGVGKKTAERLVVELKEKLATLALAASPRTAARPGGVAEQLEQALIGLGYRPQQAAQAVEALAGEIEGASLDVLLREALKRLRG